MNLQDLQQKAAYAALFAEIRITMRRYPKDAPLTLEGFQTILINAAQRQKAFTERAFMRSERQHQMLVNSISFFGQD